MSYANDFSRLAGLTRLDEWKLEGADPIRAAFDALLARHLAADVKMNKKDGYVPLKGVLTQREFHRQADAVAEIGKSVRGDFWWEWSGKNKLQVGFRDNRQKDQYADAIEKLDSALTAKGYTLKPGSSANTVFLNVRVANEVDDLRDDWLKAMARSGAKTEAKLAEAKLTEDGTADEGFAAQFAAHREAEGHPLSFKDWIATMKLALERNLGPDETDSTDHVYNQFDLAKVSAALTPFSNLSFIPAREFGPVLFVNGPVETLGALAKMAEKKLGAVEAKMTSKSQLRIAWD
jgi:hypothetical protein